MVSGNTIILVDDEWAIRQTLGFLLERRGHTVLYAADGNQAREFITCYQLEGHSPDLVVTDLWIPGVENMDLIQRLWKTFTGTPILVISGCNDSRIRRSIEEKPGLSFLEKPFTSAVFLKRVAELLDKAQTGNLAKPLTEEGPRARGGKQ